MEPSGRFLHDLSLNLPAGRFFYEHFQFGLSDIRATGHRVC